MSLGATAAKWRRALRQLWQWDIAHLQPSQPLSWRYLLPGQSPHIRLHRHLWWHSRYKLPGLLWLPLEALRWLHWQCWAAKRAVPEALGQYGLEVETRFGISVADQQQQIGYWAKAWCINPYTAYDWQLYKSARDGLAIVYDNQTSAYHALRNRKTGAGKADHRLLGDKIALAEKLTALGIPMVETARICNGDWQDLLDALKHHDKLFCKLRSGNQGESAFAVWRGENGLQGQSLQGQSLANPLQVRQAWQVLCSKGEVLIQPLLFNHALLAAASNDGAAITLRLVTRCQGENFYAWWAELQVPALSHLGSERGFWRFPVSVLNGGVSGLPDAWFLKQQGCYEYQTVFAQLPQQALPFWAELIQHSITAHAQLPNVWAIAWDWVITPEGPLLLEGNGGWGLAELQRQGEDLMQLSEFQIIQ